MAEYFPIDVSSLGSYSGSFSGSFQGNGSKLTGITASFFSGSVASASYALSASYAANGGVTQLLAGPNIALSPTDGKGQVTITATLSGSNSYNTATGSYGSFYDTTTQTNPVANVPRSMSFDSTDITNGVSISGSTNPFNTYIKTENAGIYNIQFSAQVDKTDGGTDDIVIWLRKNGIDLTDTATTLTLPTNNSKVVAAWNWFVTSATGDYYQIIWISADTDLRLLAEPISGTHPGIPSVILTANRVDQFLSNTGSFSGSFNGSFTGSLFGTASWAISASQAISASRAISASYALSASYAPSSPAFPYIGTAAITGSLIVSGTYGGINTSTNKPALYDINNIARVSWAVGVLVDASNASSVDWQTRYLQDSVETVKVDWETSTLSDGSGVVKVHWTDSALIDSTGVTAIDWESRRTFDTLASRSSDLDARYLIYPDGTTAALNYGTQGQVTLNGNAIITGSLAVATSSLGPNENTLTLGARDAVNEGGQVGFNAPGGTYTSASFLDLYQNRFRVLKGTNAGSTGEVAYWDLQTLQMAIPAYTSTGSFTGTPVAALGVDSSGKILSNLSPIRNIQNVADGTAVTGTTSNTLTKSILIPANTVGVNDVIYIKARARKTGTAGTLIVRMYVNTSAAIGGSLIATSATNAASTVYFQYSRTAVVKTTTNTETMAGNGNINADDNVAFSSAVSANNIDWTQNQYLIVAHANSSTADSSVNSFAHMQINKG